jgi:hypothetical protein
MNEELYPVLHSQVASTLVDDQAIIVLADSGQTSVLNEVGTQIWQLCDGCKTVSQIIQEIVDVYAVDFSTAKQDVTGFLEIMVEMQALILQTEQCVRIVGNSKK